MAVTGVASLILDFGFGTAIVQSKDIDDYKLSTVFYFNLLIGGFIYIFINMFANQIGLFYNSESVAQILHVTSFSFLISAASIVPNGLLIKRLEFKTLALRSFISSGISGIAGVVMALNGFGFWSIVTQQLLAALIVLLTNFVSSGWRPILYFNWGQVKGLVKFGSYIFFSSILNGIFTRLDAFIFGKVFAPATLGLYTRAQGLDVMFRNLSSSSLLTVLFPSFAKVQDDRELLRTLFFRYFEIICFLFCLIGGVFYFLAGPLFTVLFGPQWGISASYFKILILSGYAYPVSALALTIIEARGNSRNFFKAEVYKKIIFLPIFFIAYQYGVTPFLYAYLIATFLGTMVNVYFLSLEINLNLWRFTIHLFKYLMPMFLLVFTIPQLTSSIGLDNWFFILGINVATYIMLYIIYNFVVNIKGMELTLQILKIKR